MDSLADLLHNVMKLVAIPPPSGWLLARQWLLACMQPLTEASPMFAHASAPNR